jgi:ribose 5-phosphate isomerase B
MKIAIGCDHAGFPIKNQIADALRADGFDVIDFGTNSLESVDFPDFAHRVGKMVNDGEANWGIVTTV